MNQYSLSLASHDSATSATSAGAGYRHGVCTSLLMLCSLVLLCPSTHAASQADIREAAFWLEGKAMQVIRKSRVNMSDGTSGFTPDGNNYYPAFWLRDYAYGLEGCPEAYTATEIRNACLTFVNGIRYDGAGIECIKPDGTKIYKPGWDTMGENPVTDGGPFTVDVAWRTYQQLHDIALVQQIIGPLVTTMQAVPRSANGLVYIDPNKEWDRCPYGFTDSCKKTGNELFTSLLDVRASRQLADLLDVAGRSDDAAIWRTAADSKVANIRDTFWDANTGLFSAATVKCNQPDIWGSAFAVELGVATASQTQSIANYFKDNYSGIVLKGQVRHLPAGMFWEGRGGEGTGQNGAFWGVASGWVASALRTVAPDKADQMLLDMVTDYQQQGVWEYVNPDGSGTGAQHYVASILPLPVLKQLAGVGGLPVLKETGGSLNTTSDLALASCGATAFAKDVISGYAQHSIAHINDGIYGNDRSWIAGSDKSFVGVSFAQPTTFDSLAFGRDNTGVYHDRFSGFYIFQYTTSPTPNASTTDSDWMSFGVVYLDSSYLDDDGYLRHRYEFDPIQGATGVRILLEGAGIGIDELEVYSMPEPASLTMVGCGVAGFCLRAWQKRRRPSL